jgi:predicted O-methyltransferase YrrM
MLKKEIIADRFLKTSIIKLNNFLNRDKSNKRIEELKNIDPVEKIKLLCPEINQKSLNILNDMYTLNSLSGTEQDDPVLIEKTTRISIEQGCSLNKILREANVSRTLEVGFAYGFSTIWILDTLLNKTNALHIAVDPTEKIMWKGVGLKQVEKLTGGKFFQWENDWAIHSLTRLISKKQKFDFIFIDGNHRFDDVIVDFYLSDQLIEPNGLIAFDDMWMTSIKKATAFITKNYSYEIVQQNVSNMLVLRKIENDRRKWNHFVDFN